MLIKSGLVTQMSGSIGGMTGSHNKGGMYLRARAVPVNPNTAQQVAVRSIVSDLSNRWANTLTAPQRAAWDVYALNVPLTGPLGDPRQVSGLNMYVRSNVPIVQSGLSRVDGAPTIFDLGEYTPPTVDAVDSANTEVDIAFTNTDDWANEDGAAMLVFASRPQNQSKNYFKGPYRYAGRINGNGTTAPTSPASIALPFPVGVGEKLFVRLSVVRADGRLSTPIFLSGTGA